MTTTYPTRSKFHANRVTRLMTKACAAQEIGSEGAWLVAVVAGVEDAKRYTGAVTFYNEQLMPLCGFRSRSTLVRARKLAADAGWLHYEPGGKSKPGRYWSTIPAEYVENLDDSPVDETPDQAAEGDQAASLRVVSPDDDQADQVDQVDKCRTDSVRQTGPAAAKCRTDSVRQRDGNATANERLSYPYPNPNPTEDSATPAEPAAIDQELANLVAWWNKLSAAGYVRAAVRAEPVSSAVAAGFRRYKRSAELRELLGDLDALADEIRASEFVRKAGWFTLAKLLGGRNKAGEYIAEVLKNGGYRDDKNGKTAGPGQRHEADRGRRFRESRGTG